MIDNTNKIGYYYCKGFSSPEKKKILYCFNVPSIRDANIEIDKITDERKSRGLTTFFEVYPITNITPILYGELINLKDTNH